MKLMKISNLIPEKIQSEVLEILIEKAKEFIQAGGILTFGDWAELNNNERIAMVMARKIIQFESEEWIILEGAVNKAIKMLNKKL